MVIAPITNSSLIGASALVTSVVHPEVQQLRWEATPMRETYLDDSIHTGQMHCCAVFTKEKNCKVSSDEF